MNTSPLIQNRVYSKSSVSTNSNLPQTPPRTRVEIGSGAYGVVYMIDDSTIEKRMDLFEEGIPSHRNLKEVMFLKSFEAPFIPKIQSVNITNQKIVIRENYCGITLDKYTEQLSYVERIRKLPELMCQMGRILIWLKRHNIAHIDIKPSNLCIDKEGKLTLIDFGLVGPVCKNSSSYSGTLNLCDPFTVKYNKKISYEYDMMGMGLCLFYFLNKSYMEADQWTGIAHLPYELAQDNANVILDLDYHKKNITKYLGHKIAELLEEMVRLDSDNRIKPFDLYGSIAFQNLWEKYPLITEEKEEVRIPNIKDKDANNLRILFDWFGEVLSATKSLHLLNYVTKLMILIISRKSLPSKYIQLYGVCCLYIADILFDLDVFFPEVCEKLICNQYSSSIILSTVLNILAEFDWNIFPQENMADWNTEFRNISSSTRQLIVMKNTTDFEFIVKPECLKNY